MALSGFRKLMEILDRQTWLDPIAEQIQQLAGRAFEQAGSGGSAARDFLNGVWLGHALHPVLTDLPIGFWTAALALDTAAGGSDDLAGGADLAVALGLIAALPTAAAGLADWQYTMDRSRRIGLVHAGLNTAGVVLYAVSLAQRLSGKRAAGRIASGLAYCVMGAASYLGGELIGRGHLSVDRANEQPLPEDFVGVLAESELAENQPKRAQAGATPLVLVRQNGQVYALAETCAHMAGPLSEGKLEDGSIVCPWHGSRFALADGRVINGPATFRQPYLETRVRNGQIEVRAVAQTG